MLYGSARMQPAQQAFKRKQLQLAVGIYSPQWNSQVLVHLQRGKAQRSPPLARAGFQGGARTQQRLHGLALPRVRGQVHGREAPLRVLAIHGCPGLDQRLDGALSPVHGCVVQWSAPCT